MDTPVNPPNPATARPAMQTIRHELRTPVNHIIGFSEMLLEEAADVGMEQEYAPLKQVVASGKQILATVTEMLSKDDVEVREADFIALHQRIDPSLRTITEICTQMISFAQHEGKTQFAHDLGKIMGAVGQLDQISSGHLAATDGSDFVPSQSDDTEIQSADLRGHLLLVDDNDMNREMLSRRLERMGYQVTQANDGYPALDAMRAQHFDLILLDIMMPGLDGYAVLRAMSTDSNLRHVPVIVLSALDDMASVVQAIELGADDYLPKPVNQILLKARIGACLYKHQVYQREVEYLHRIQREKQRADELLNVVIPIGVALSVEKDFNRLLERIVTEAQKLCHADGATLYLRTEDEKLRFMIVRTRSLNIAMGGVSGKDIPYPPLRIYDEHSGEPQRNYVVVETTMSGEPILIPDAYGDVQFDLSGTHDFDRRTGYRSISMLSMPLKDGAGYVIGVLQLINAQDEHGTVIAFDEIAVQMVQSLGRLAAAALTAYTREQQLRQEISELRIELDQIKKQREIEQVTTSSYFGQFQPRTQPLRADVGEGGTRRGDKGQELQKRVYTVDGQEIHVHEQGPPNRQTIIMIHGWSSSWYALSPLLPMLSERNRCVVVDLPGYGDSPPLRERATIIAYVDLLAKLIKQISPNQQVILIGHSMGGMISLTMSLRHPPLIERMVLLCPTISGKLSFWINVFISPITMLERHRLANSVVAMLEPYMLSATDRLMRPASFADRTLISEQDYIRLRADARRAGQGRVRAECFWAMRENDLSEKLSMVTTPALVIWGMEDNTVPLRDASLVDEFLSEADLQVLPRAGHWPQFESPERTKRLIRSFLGKPLKLLRVQL